MATETTAGELIQSALQRLSYVQAGESPSSEDSALGLLRLNDLLDAYGTESLTIYSILRTLWTISSSEGTIANPYTVGSGGDIAIVRPVFLDDIRFQDTSISPTLEYPLTVLTEAAWIAIPQKGLTGTYPTMAYYNPTFTTARGSLYLLPIPSSTTLQGVLYSKVAVPQFTATSDSVSLPPGYARFFRDNLAIEMAPDLRASVTAELALSARESKAQIKRANMRISDMQLDTAVLPRTGPLYDINSDS